MRNIAPSIGRRLAAIEEKLAHQTFAQSSSGRTCSARTNQTRL